MKTFLAVVLLLGAGGAIAATPIVPGRDYHSYADTTRFRVRHVDLDLQAVFEHKRLSGVVDLTIARLAPDATTLTLDTRDLGIRQVWWLRGANDLVPLDFNVGPRDPMLGAPLHIEVPTAAGVADFIVRISYQTRPEASGLQWVDAAQTADKTHPFLFTQSQAIHARSWIPLQDSPQAGSIDSPCRRPFLPI